MPITALRDTMEISVICNSSDEPIFITKNGYGDMVVMSIETYERDLALADVYRKLSSAEKQIANGEVLDAKIALDGLKFKYGY